MINQKGVNLAELLHCVCVYLMCIAALQALV